MADDLRMTLLIIAYSAALLGIVLPLHPLSGVALIVVLWTLVRRIPQEPERHIVSIRPIWILSAPLLFLAVSRIFGLNPLGGVLVIAAWIIGTVLIEQSDRQYLRQKSLMAWNERREYLSFLPFGPFVEEAQYQLTPKGIAVNRVIRPWADYNSFYADEADIVFDRKHLSNKLSFTGPDEDRDELIRIIADNLPQRSERQ